MTMDCRKLISQVQLLPPLFWQPAKLKATLGTLHDRLTEIICMILRHSALSALMSLRLTNSCANYVVESWPSFKVIMTSGTDLVRAAIVIEASIFLTVSHMLAVTFGDHCELCEELGSFVQLVKCMRCYFYCLTNDRRLHCINLKYANGCIPNQDISHSAVTVLGLKLSKRDLRKVPRVRTMPQILSSVLRKWNAT